MTRSLPAVLMALALLAGPPSSCAMTTLPDGFQEDVVFSGLNLPTALRFAPDGRIFVAEKSGLVKVFDSLDDAMPVVVADLRTNVHNYWDRGLLGLALDPGFPDSPYVYLLYTYNAPPGGTAPYWPPQGASPDDDSCPVNPGATTDGCVVTGRLSRLRIDASNHQVGDEQVLIENNWCQQFPSHSIGDLVFGRDGALYVSGGDGASFGPADWGQFGGTLPDSVNPVTPRNPCGDPPGGVGGAMDPPSAQGGALRAQDLRTPGDPVAYNGAILRVDPATGDALPDNPLWGGAALDDDRVVAYGLRNPFRFTMRPNTGELWIGDVGWNQWEEIDRLVDPTTLQLSNFGWPCYEGNDPQVAYASVGLDICNNLYAEGVVVKPYFTWAHGNQPGDAACRLPASSITGISFYDGGTYPADYGKALFFADYSVNCIWTMRAGTDGLPDPATVQTFASHAATPVDLEPGPNGDIFYVDLVGGTVRRIRYLGSSDRPPVAVAHADVTTGSSPLTVHFDGSASSDPDAGDTISFAWDLDGDGDFDDSTDVAPAFTYAASGTYVVRLRVSDGHGGSAVDSLTVSVDNTPPVAVITAPSPALVWRVGDAITFAGSASDAEQVTLPPSALHWRIVLQHCPGFACHEHIVEEFSGVSGGTFVAPDHEYPSLIELRLTATDAGGLTNTTSVQLQPVVTTLAFDTAPPGLKLAVGPSAQATPFTRDVIVGSDNSISAPASQTGAGYAYAFASWSDGGAASHDVVAPDTGATFVASYAGGRCGDGIIQAGEACDGSPCCSATCQIAPDDDGDGLCNPIDPCTGGAQLLRTRLALSRLGLPPGDDRLRLSGQVQLPISPSPVIDPTGRGVRLVITDTAGLAALDTALVAGFDPATGVGWTARGKSSWRYDDRNGLLSSITRMTIKLSPESGLVKFKASGKNGTYTANPAALPLTVTVVFDPPAATTGRCGESVFVPLSCVPASGGQVVRCR